MTLKQRSFLTFAFAFLLLNFYNVFSVQKTDEYNQKGGFMENCTILKNVFTKQMKICTWMAENIMEARTNHLQRNRSFQSQFRLLDNNVSHTRWQINIWTLFLRGLESGRLRSDPHVKF